MPQETLVPNLDGTLESNILSFFKELSDKNIVSKSEILCDDIVRTIRNQIVFNETEKRKKMIIEYISDRISAKIHKKSIEEESIRIKALWDIKSKYIQQLTNVYSECYGYSLEDMKNYSVVVSMVNGSEIRVYINTNEPSAKDNQLLATLYLTGNDNIAPETLYSCYKFPNDFEQQITQTLKELGTKFRSVYIRFGDTYKFFKSEKNNT